MSIYRENTKAILTFALHLKSSCCIKWNLITWDHEYYMYK